MLKDRVVRVFGRIALVNHPVLTCSRLTRKHSPYSGAGVRPRLELAQMLCRSDRGGKFAESGSQLMSCDSLSAQHVHRPCWTASAAREYPLCALRAETVAASVQQC